MMKYLKKVFLSSRDGISLFLVLVFLGIFCCRAASAGTAPANATIIFTDMKGHWAESHVARLTSLEVVKGYPDRTFRPDTLVSGLEAAVLIIRSGGFIKEAGDQSPTGKSNARNKASGSPSDCPVPWGQPFIDLAIQKGFLVPGEFNPSVPASRIQVAGLLARALYLVPVPESEVPAWAGFTTGQIFTDENSLSQADRACLRAVAGADVMSGYPDGTFRPDRPLTRAELAAVLSRLVDRGWVKTAADRRFTGWISGLQITGKNRELVLASPAGAKKLRLAKSVQCFREGKSWPVDQSIDFRCEIIQDARGEVSWINLLEKRDYPEKTEKIRGSVKTVVLGSENLLVLSDMDCRDRIIPLAWDAVVSGKSAGDFRSLKPGVFVEVETARGQVKKATLLEVKSVSGTVKSLGRRLDLEKGSWSSGKPPWFNNWDRARIVDRDGVKKWEVVVGDKVKITYLDPQPNEIDDEIPLEIVITQ